VQLKIEINSKKSGCGRKFIVVEDEFTFGPTAQATLVDF
jgi:hypothetical protein